MEIDTHQEAIEFTTTERKNGKGLIMDFSITSFSMHGNLKKIAS